MLSLYVDWEGAPDGFTDFVKTEIPWVTYARDRQAADVFVLVTT